MLNSLADYVRAYRRLGFLPFPLSGGTKMPPEGCKLFYANEIPFKEGDNIGLFTGSSNRFTVIDADDERAQKNVTWFLKKIGLYEHLTIVRTPTRGGLHFWVRIDAPEWVQTFYKLPSEVGHGEFRFRRPAYVVGVGSAVESGKYEFIQGGIEEFVAQPLLPYDMFYKLLPHHAREQSNKLNYSGDTSQLTFESFGLHPVAKNPNPPVLNIIPLIHSSQYNIPKISTYTGKVKAGKRYASRSEAEAGLVTGLIKYGWSFNDVLKLFTDERLPHFKSTPNPEKYLSATYLKCLGFYAQHIKSQPSF